MRAIKTTEYFNMTEDELVADKYTDESNYTKEERMMFDTGLVTTFFDSMEEYKQEEIEYKEWLTERNLEVKVILKTVNERIAVVSI